MYKTVCVIPARGGSKGVPNKNIADVREQPLIAYSILDALQTKSICQTYVSTDSEEIRAISYKYGAEVPFLRPKQFATDKSPDMEWATHFLNWFFDNFGYNTEYIVHLRATTPFREVKLIEEALALIKSVPSCTSLISVQKEEEVYKTFSNEDGFLKSIFDDKYHLMPRQNCPKAYLPNGYIDILKTKTILDGSFHGDKILAFETARVVEIDTKEDLDYAEYVGSKIL